MNTVVFGNLSVSPAGRHGARLTRVAPTTAIPYRRSPVGPAQLPYLVGRSGELARVRPRTAVEFTGPCGAGKTTLLRNVPQAVYVRVGATALEDLVQDLMRSFYAWQGPVRFSTEDCARFLAAVDGTVVLDDVSYTPQQLGYLQQALRGCALVIGSATPALGAAGESYALEGLSEGAAIALLARDLGRALSGAELAVVGRLLTAVGGQPLHLRQAAALVRYDGRTLADVTARAEGADTPSRRGI
ncbi:ATP-binding protein [Streptomyces sp. S6]